MSFEDLESGRPLTSFNGTHLQHRQQDPSQSVAAGVFQINTAVASFQRLVNSLLLRRRHRPPSLSLSLSLITKNQKQTTQIHKNQYPFLQIHKNQHPFPPLYIIKYDCCCWLRLRKMPSLEEELFPSTPGKFKIDRAHAINRQFHRCFASTSTMFLWALFLIALTASYLSFQSFVDSGSRYFSASWGGIQWEKQVRTSAEIHRSGGLSVLVTGAAGFVGSHVSLALKKRGDGVVGIDNFNNYYDPSLKKSRKVLLASRNIFIVEGDINDQRLLAKLFDVVAFTHVMHLAAQAGVRYAMENPNSYIHSNIAGLVTLLEASKSANPQPAIVWASSSSVYGLNDKVPFSESDRTDQPASLYAATKKAGEEITHTYNHIYGLSVTGLRFFTVYGPWGRPDMAYFSFTRNILQGKPITVYRGKNHVDLARDFTYIDDIVKGCIGSLDTSGKSTGSGGKKKGPAPYRIFNLGNTSPVTVPTLVSILEKHLKVKAKKIILDMPGNGDVPFTHANISSARRELGYKPTTDLQTGLKKFVRWYLSYYGYNHGKPVN